MALINQLIDKQDSFEIVRDQISAILKTEMVNQEALALTAGKDVNLWKLTILEERSDNFEQFIGNPDIFNPIINVSFDNSSITERSSGIVKEQTTIGIYNIDCYGYSRSRETVTGHEAGDRLASLEVQRSIRLVRNILMSGVYSYLGLRGLVGRRWIDSIVKFTRQLDSPQTQEVIGSRINLSVQFIEDSPQTLFDNLELISVQVERALDGEVLINADYDFS